MVASVLLAGGLLAASLVAAAVDLSRRVQFDIPAQPLATALLRFSEQASVQLAAPSELLGGLETKGVRGEHATGEALGVLLHGTGLTFQALDEQTVAIRQEKTSRSNSPGGPAGVVGGIASMSRDPPNDRLLLTQADDKTAKQKEENKRNAEEDQPKSPPSTADETVELGELVVTGSHIRGAAPAGSPPAIVISRDEIQRTGYATVEQLTRSLPQNFGGDISSNMFEGPGRINGTDSSGASSVNLRGLGVQSTLVLINGRRVAGSGSIGAFTDTSLIPLSAIERIEVLTDGASAIYGSDAVAGVVNFVLRDDFDGAETSVRGGSVTEGSHDEFRFSQTLGKSWESGNALLGYEYLRQSDLKSNDRDFSSSVPEFSLLPKQDRHGALFAANQRVTDNIKFFANGLYAYRTNEHVTNIAQPFSVEANVRNYALTAGASIELPRLWMLELSGHYTENRYHAHAPAVDRSTENTRDSKASLPTISAIINGSPLRIWGGNVRIAVGAEVRRERLFNQLQVDGRVFDPQSLKRDVSSAFGELLIPVVGEENARAGLERLEITLAGRYEDYSDLGSSSVPKVGIRWSPSRTLSLRGNYGRSFRAPNLTDLTENDTTAQLANISDLGLPEDGRLVFITTGTNSQLGPETADIWTAGVDFEPAGVSGLRISVTYFDIQYKDRIDDAQRFIFDILQQPDIFAPLLVFNPTQQQLQRAIDRANNAFGIFNFAGPGLDPDPSVGPLDADIIMEVGLANVAVAHTNGVDLAFRYGFQNYGSHWDLSLAATYVNKFDLGFSEAAPSVDIIDTIFNPPDLRIRGGATWSRSGWAATAAVNYTDSYRDSRLVPARRVDAWTTVDLQLSFTTEERSANPLLRNTRFSLNILNALDEDPPEITDFDPDAADAFDTFGYDAANATPLGRFVAFEITKSF